MSREKGENHDISDGGATSTDVRPETPDGVTLKEYFDERLYPHLSAALAACARERPEDPVSFVGEFLVNASRKQ